MRIDDPDRKTPEGEPGGSTYTGYDPFGNVQATMNARRQVLFYRYDVSAR